MKVCDKHPDTKAVDTLHFPLEDVRIDVCDVCKFAVMELLSAPPIEPKKRGRPPREAAPN